MFATKSCLSIVVLLFSLGWPMTVYGDESGCVYNRTVYPQGSQMCQGGTMMQCEEGAWSATAFVKTSPCRSRFPRVGT